MDMHNKNLNRSIDIYIGKKIKNKYIKGQRLINKLRSAVPLPSKASKMKLKKYPNSQPLQNTHIKIHTKREISFLFLFSQKKIENIYRKSPILSSPICHCPCPASTTPNCSQYTMPLLALSTVSRYQPEHKGPKGIIKQMQLGPNQTKQQSNKPRSNTNK